MKHKMKYTLSSLTFKMVTGLLILISSTSCQNDKKNQISENAKTPEVPVEKVIAGNGVVTTTYPTAIEGTTNVEVRAQTSGYLRQILVDEGDYVKAGQVLFKIDARPYQEQYNSAKAAVATAEANLKNIKIDLDRKTELVENKIVSNLQVQQASANYDAAKASLQQAKANMNKAQIDLNFSTVTAPVSGYIGRIPYRIGSLIDASSKEPLTLLTDINQLYAYFSMSETDFAIFQDEKVKNSKSDSVSLVLANGAVYDHKGVIDAITGQFDKNTGSISIRAKFSNPQRKLRAGNTGKIEITRTLDNALIVPIRATTSIQEKIYVFKVDKNNKTEQVEIKIGGKTNENYYVTAGLQDGDLIVVGNLGIVRPDMVITPKK